MTEDEMSILPEGDERYRFNSTKLPWHMDRVRAKFDRGEKIVPIHMDVGISKACNIECVFCLGKFQHPSKEIMPYNVTVNLLRDAGRLGVRSMGVIGDGEPTLNPALYEAVQEGRREGLDIGLATNGVALSERKLKILVEHCHWIRFNVPAVEREAYEDITRRDYWERVKRNVTTAVRLNEEAGHPCTIGLQMVTIPESLDQILPEARFAVDIGADYFEVKQCTLPDEGESGMRHFDLAWYKRPEVVEILRKAQGLSTERTVIVPKWTMMQSLGRRNYDHCLDVQFLMQVSGDSKCYPCAVLFNKTEFCYGDLKKQSLGEILASERYASITRRMEKDFDVHTECKGCCRHDRNNEFLYYYVHEPKKFREFMKENVEGKPKPDHINFI